ncbi:MAG: hypothetical protein JSR18_01915 [Proteobacteria bacterium]|nr:hypothetical protein [Pseudomonadota bacterium]
MASNSDDDRAHDPASAFAAAFTPQQAAEFMQRMWNPFGMPVPGFTAPATGAPTAPAAPFPNPALMFAALDPIEVQRKIDELRIVENWLKMSLSMTEMSVKTLELQKASLEAMQPAAATRAKR